MFDTIILLTGPVETKTLAAVLRDRNPALEVHAVETLDALTALSPELLARARLIGFVTPVIVPRAILEKLGYGAYNFHPGPPHYPGRLPSHFAIYDNATDFGATAHEMRPRVDTGPIVAVARFTVPPRATVIELEMLALTRLARLFWDLAPQLATSSAPLPHLPVNWSGKWTTQQDHRSLCEIRTDISPEELERRIGVFGAGHFGISPTVTVHGRKFRYVPDDAAIESPSVVPPDAPQETRETPAAQTALITP